jgi:DNA replication protein DnaC
MAKPLDRELEAGLRRLKLRRVRELAPELLQTARTQRWPPEELLAVLVREEIEARARSNLARRLKAAQLPGHKTLAGFDPRASELPRATFEFLRSLEWLERGDNLVFAGPARAISARRSAAPPARPAAGCASSRPTSSSRRSTAGSPTTRSAG